MLARRLGVVERARQAHALDRRLRHAPNGGGRLYAERIEHGGHHVDDVGVLRPHLAARPHALGPGQDERIADAAAVSLALPAAERRVAGVRPAPREMVEDLGPADIVDGGQPGLDRVWNIVEEPDLADRSCRTALGAGAVVGDQHDQRVVVLADVFEELDQLADVVISVLEEACEHLHHPRVQPPLVGRERLPVLHVGIVPRQLCVRGDQTERLLLLEDLLAVGVPAGVEPARVFIRPLLRHVVWRVRGAGGEIHEERLVGGDLFGVGDHRLGLVDQVGRQVVALLRCLLRFNLGVVADKFRVVLVGVAAQETIIALEPATQRPTIVRAGRRHRLLRGQVPFADAVGVVALLQQDLRKEAVLERDVAI